MDGHPNDSVIFVSFGSGGTLTARQLTELAWGLEMSRQRFIWVVRPLIENDPSAAVLTVGNGCNVDATTPEYLPSGFCTRTKGLGLVVPMWGPQGEIPRHPSIGGFMSHCGWNSTLESIVNQCMRPMYAEQKMNATLLEEELGVALRPKAAEGGAAGRKEVQTVVREILVGKEGKSKGKGIETKCGGNTE